MPEKSKDFETVFSYFNELNIIAQLSNNMFEQQLPDGLTTSQFSVLNWFVRVDDEATPGRLAKAFQVTGGAMTNTLKKLESKKLVAIRIDEKSLRRKIVTLTPKGRKAREKAIAAVSPLLGEFESVFAAASLKKPLKHLVEVRQYLDDYRFRQE